MTTSLVLIGGGRMGCALARRWISEGIVSADNLLVCESSLEQRAVLESLLPTISVVCSPSDALRSYDGVVIAVKPADVEKACDAALDLGVGRALSIAAGVRISSLQKWLPGVQVVRAMPNTPALVGAGMSAISVSDSSERAIEALEWAELLLGAVGSVLRLKESELDAVTAVSGSGPAYVFLLAEAMMAGAVAQGLSPEVAKQLVVETVSGAARMLSQPDANAVDLRQQVTSPNGTTASAITILQSRDFEAIVSDAIDAATTRSAELGVG